MMTFFPPHCIEPTHDGWRCTVCGWAWPRTPHTYCPGVKRYTSMHDVPAALASESALRGQGYKPGAPAVGCIVSPGSAMYVWLYLIAEAVPTAAISPRQRDALRRGRATQARSRMTQEEGIDE